MSSVITIGFTGRTRACLRTEFTSPIADDERRETLIHVALLTARTFAALSADNQVTFAGTLREWIEDQFIACPTRLVPGDPMACLPRFASTFVAPVREYALATKGCNQNGRGIEFFLPMALVSFLRHVAVTFPNPEDLLKPALALCGAAVITPLTMQTHFQAAAASIPKVAPVVEKKIPEEAELVTQEAAHRPPVPRAPIPEPIPRPVPPRARRERRRTLVISACVAALLIIAGVQYLSVYQPEVLQPPSTISPPPAIITPPPPPVIAPREPQAVKQTPPPAPVVEPPKATVQVPTPSAPIVATPFEPETKKQAESPPTVPAAPGEEPFTDTRLQPESAQSSKDLRVYQQKIHELAEDAVAQLEVMVNAIEGQILTQFGLGEVLAYGEHAVRSDLKALERAGPPAMYEEKHHNILLSVEELVRLAKELRTARMQPAATELQQRLVAIESRVDETLRAVDNF